MNNTTLPKMEEFVVGDLKSPRKGIYAEVLERLKDLASADPPKGLWVAFPSSSASNGAIKKMGEWAAEDGYQVFYHAWDGSGRRVHLQPLPKDGEEQ